MACEKPLIFLPCGLTGEARTAQAVNPSDTVIQLMNGQGSRFPQVPAGKWFYIRVVGCDGCCETMRVVGRDVDKLHVQRGFGTQCTCIKSNSFLTYTTDTQYFYEDILSVLPLNVADPLHYNCETNTISVDCSKLHSSKCGGCGCEGTSDTAAAENGNVVGTGGLRGPQGDKGDQGVGISSMVISATKRLIVTLTDGRVVDAGSVPTAQGLPGPRGDKGDQGEKGDKGDPGVGITTFSLQDGNLMATMTDGQSKNLGSVIGPQGKQGIQGVAGPQGVNFSYVEDNTDGYLCGASGSTVKLVLLTPNGEEDGGTFEIPPAGYIKMRKLNVTTKTPVIIRHNGTTMAISIAGG